MIFSERKKLAEKVEEWCKFHSCPDFEIIPTTVNIISILDMWEYLKDGEDGSSQKETPVKPTGTL